MVIRADRVNVCETDAQRSDGRGVSPFIPVSTPGTKKRGGRGDEGDQAQVEQMRGDDFGQRIVEVRLGVVGRTKWARGEHVGAELQVEQTRFEVDEFVTQSVVGDGWRAEGGQAREEHVDGDLEPGLREAEDVLGGVEGDEGEGEVDEREGEEEE